MTPSFLVCLVAALGTVTGIHRLQRVFEVPELRRRRNSAIALGGGACFVGVVGFERNVGFVHSSGLPEPLAFLAQASLLWLALVGVVIAWYYHAT